MSVNPDDPYATLVRQWLEISGKSRTALGKATNFDRSYVSKIASGAEHGSLLFAERADEAMNTGGVLARAWREQRHQVTTPPETGLQMFGGLTVDQDLAELRFDTGAYRLTQRRRLVNAGA